MSATHPQEPDRPPPAAAGVLSPATVAEVQELLRGAAGVGDPAALYQPARPGQVRLSLAGLSRILEIDAANLVARVEAGVRLGELDAALRARRLRFVPAHPPFHAGRTVGELYGAGLGNVASLKYGPARHFLLGSKVVLPGGDVLETGGRTVKNVTGYDLTRFLNAPLAGLGVAVELLLKLHPEPPASARLAARFEGLDALLGFTQAVREAHLVPAYLLWLDPEAQRLLGRDGAGLHVVLLGLDGIAEEVAEQAEAALALLRRGGAAEVLEGARADHELEGWGDVFEPGGDLVLANELKVEARRRRDFLEGFAAALRARAARAGLFGQLAEGNLSVRAPAGAGAPPDPAQAILDAAEASGARVAGRFARASGRPARGALAEIEDGLRRSLAAAGRIGR